MEQILARPNTEIRLGRVGENKVRQVIFDLSPFAVLGPGHAVLVAELPEDDRRYPVPLKEENGTAVWTVTAADLSRSGFGQVQLSYLVGDRVAKTEVYQTCVASGMGDPVEPHPPEPQQGWVDEILKVGAAAADSAERAAEKAGEARDTAAAAKHHADRAAQEADRAGSAVRTLIDDALVSREKVWSSDRSRRYTVELTCPPFELSGPVITCEPVGDYPLEAVSRIEPRQEGQGNPSAVNVRPIRAWTGVNLIRCGKNMAAPHTVMSVYCVDSYHGMRYDPDHGSKTYVVKCKPSTQYTVLRGGNPEIFRIWCIEEEVQKAPGASVPVYGFQQLTASSGRIVTTRSAKYICVQISVSDFADTPVQITEGEAFPPVEQYSGTAYRAEFNRNIYGGTYNWATGELDITEIGFTIDRYVPEEWWRGPNSNRAYCRKMPADMVSGIGNTGICDKLKYRQYAWDASVRDTNCFAFSSGNLYIVAPKGAATTQEEFEAYIKTLLPITFVAAPKERTVLRFPTQTIAARPGVNTLYSDTGDTAVRGYRDPAAMLREQNKKIEQLEAAAFTARGDV